MFRKPRNETESSTLVKPSTGRPPTPPLSGVKVATQTRTSATLVSPPRMQGTMKSTTAKAKPAAAKATAAKRNPAKPNASILNFFRKADAPGQGDDSLFVSDTIATPSKTVVPSRPIVGPADTSRPEQFRFNESSEPSKRRRLSQGSSPQPLTGSPLDQQTDHPPTPLQELDTNPKAPPKAKKSLFKQTLDDEITVKPEPIDAPTLQRTESCPPPKESPMLKREETSFAEDLFEGMEDFVDDEFPEGGEEFSERLWLQEQRALEREFEEEGDIEVEDVEESSGVNGDMETDSGRDAEAACPICNASLGGLNADQASLHVNRCLDGDPLPVSRPVPKPEPEIKKEHQPVPNHKRFQRAAIARPPQQNPFDLGSTGGGSAFAKIMSSHAEDEAWSVAASNEVAARGKPAFKRTCPFYKILPGFFTCVDAFRYGAVEGCNAYFLSHFHSDHYIGLTSSWCHGPIYCSHVTANLVRQQLRVDPKWVIDLEFEQKCEVPGTQGVFVTMISANHCPGSSLFLFEKTIGKGNNPKQQRVLHCGDFRACPAHVQHPLLRPDVLDAVSGKKRQQKLDVCYLDTTYLTPKYSFPSQEQVIKACADMCVSLSKDKVDGDDSWEQTKKQRAGSGMVKFVRTELKDQADQPEEIDGIVSAAKNEGKSRGRLLVICGTYSIGKERICLGVAKALNSKIFAPPNKEKICRALEDPELNARLTGNPLEAQVHMQMLMEIRAETLADYLTGYKPHFTRIVGFRPSGWNYRPPNSRFLESPSVQTVLNSDNWKTKYSMAELVPQRGSTKEASCFGVPYSEHSSFRELSMFCCALRIDKIIPTVNVGSAKSRDKMKVWIDKWAMEKKKNGLFQVPDDMVEWS